LQQVEDYYEDDAVSEEKPVSADIMLAVESSLKNTFQKMS
jgi:hypothetical protein